jgi:uncharacterized protein
MATFGTQAALAQQLLTAFGEQGDDGSHDQSHLLRVWQNASAIAEHEPDCDRTVLMAAVILHDCVAVEKNAPHRAQASRLSADRARSILAGLGWDAVRIERTAHAIEAHSFSAGIAPQSVEARIMQDADRLDAIGAMGIARCFYVAGRMGSRLYNPDDPTAARRDFDDQAFALDHFGAKLFKVAGTFQTRVGQAMADERTRTMQDFMRAFLDETGSAESGRPD